MWRVGYNRCLLRPCSSRVTPLSFSSSTHNGSSLLLWTTTTTTTISSRRLLLSLRSTPRPSTTASTTTTKFNVPTRRNNSGGSESGPPPPPPRVSPSANSTPAYKAASNGTEKPSPERVMQEYAALFRPGPQGPKEEFTTRVLGAPFDVAFRGTVGVAVAVLLLLVTFGIAAKLSDFWDVLQLTRRLLDDRIPAAPGECFGREEDVRYMASRLGERPEFIYFVGGSPRSGLTTVVNKVLSQFAGNSYIINLREFSPMTGMADVNHALCKSLGFLEILPSFQNLKHSFSGWEIKGVLIPSTEAQRVEALKATLEKLTRALKFVHFLSSLKSSHTRINSYPIIAIDHFKDVINIPQSKETLNVLLKWALYITHEVHLAHIILVSSDPRVAYMLTNDEVLSGRIISISIDSIAKKPALTYLRNRLARSRYPRDITEEEGDKIYAEIGSAFLDLNRVEAHMCQYSVDQALDVMHRSTISRIIGALGAEGRSWSPTQLWRTIKLLAASETGELDYFQLAAEVFNGNEKVLHDLFDAGILFYRVGSHNGGEQTPVVTAYTPFVLFCCKQLAKDPRLNAIMDDSQKWYEPLLWMRANTGP